MSLIREGEIERRVADLEARRERERQMLAEKLAVMSPSSAATDAATSDDASSSRAGFVTPPSVVVPPPAAIPHAKDDVGSAAASTPPAAPHSHGMYGAHMTSTENSPSGTISPKLSIRSVNPGFRPHGSSHQHGIGMPLLPAQMAPSPSKLTSAHHFARKPDARPEDTRLEALERQVEQMRTMVLNTVDENRFLRLEVDVLRDALLERDDAEAQARAENSLRLIGRRAGTRELRDQSICTNCLKRTKCFRCYACCSVEYCSSRCQMENFAAHVELCRHITERCM